MRRALIWLLILVIAGTVGALSAVRELAEPEEQVEFTEETLFGDHRFADGLTVTQNVQMKYHLLWESKIRLGESDHTAETKCRNRNLLSWRMPEGDEPDYFGIMMMTDAAPFIDLPDEEIAELAASIKPGEEGTKLIRAADYRDYYLWAVNIEIPDLFYGSTQAEGLDIHYSPEHYAVQTIREFFRIPVVEDEYYLIHMVNSGSITQHSIESYDNGDMFSISSQSAVADDAVYFCFSNRTQRGKIVDTSQIPGGYGIYILPIGRIDQKNYHGLESYKGPDVLVDELRVFYPIDPQAILLDLSISTDQKTLLLHTEEEGQYIVSVIDTESAELLQRIVLAEDFSALKETFNLIHKGDYCAVWIDHSLSVLRQISEKSWELFFQTDPKPIELQEDYWIYTAMSRRHYAFDGERLAITATDDVWPPHNGGCGFQLAVYDRNGLEYVGRYDSSLGLTNLPEHYHNQNAIEAYYYNDGNICWE